MATVKDAAKETDDWKAKLINEAREKEKEIAKTKNKLEAATAKRKALKEELDELNEELHAIIRGGADRESKLNFPEAWSDKPIHALKIDAKTMDALALMMDDIPINTVGELAEKLKDESIELAQWFSDRHVSTLDKAIDGLKNQFPAK